MVTKVNDGAISNPLAGFSYVGLSVDTKPTDAINGTTFFAMDTKKVYMYDETNKTWREI